MAFELLNDNEKAVICECMRFIQESDAIDTVEFETRIGIDREEFTAITKPCPALDDNHPLIELCVNNSLNEVCYGLNINDRDWNNWFSISRKKVENTYKKWTKLKGWNRAGIM